MSGYWGFFLDSVMILFNKDWGYYPTALPDYDSSNKSAVKLAALYKKMGIKNWQFCLALIDQGLKTVDPWDENLTLEFKERILAECRRNPFYFFREVFRAPKKSYSSSCTSLRSGSHGC